MKKLFLVLTMAVIAISCSSDDDNGSSSIPSNTIKAKVNGVSKTFEASATDASNEGTTYYLVVAAVDENEYMTFGTYENPDTGDYFYENLVYVKDGVEYLDYGSFDGSITHDASANRLTGTFSGELSADNNSAGAPTVTFTNGQLNVVYE